MSRRPDRRWRRGSSHLRSTSPNFLFSTWPIPRWVDGRSEVVVTNADNLELAGTADFVYGGPADYPRLLTAIGRLTAVGGCLKLLGGTFELPGPIEVPGSMTVIGVGNSFRFDV